VPFSSLTVRRYAEPAYPRNALARRLPGWVDVVFTVEPSGRTRDVQVAGADPPGVFDDAAVAAVRRWRFAEPDLAGGTGTAAGPVYTRVRVRFEPR
jgi:protein TonB